MSNILLTIQTNQLPQLTVRINDADIEYQVEPSGYDDSTFFIKFSTELHPDNLIQIGSQDLIHSLTLSDIIIDDIQFGLVTFLCTTINGNQATQLNQPGFINIVIKTPIWQYWCEKMNSFNYKDFPLGSTN